MTSETSFNDFFALFQQPVSFHIDTEQLNQRMRSLQKQYHPDNLSQDQKSQAQAQQESERLSALINHAYQTLKAEDSRAAYLLEMSGQEVNLNDSIADLDFLDDAMTLRMDLEDAIAAKQQNTLHSLQQQISDRIQSQSKRFVNAYEQERWSTAIDATQKLKFLVKLDADVSTALDELSTTDDNDDDLYVWWLTNL